MGDNVQDVAELGEDGVEGLFEVVLLDLLVEVVDVDGVVGRDIHLLGESSKSRRRSLRKNWNRDFVLIFDLSKSRRE